MANIIALHRDLANSTYRHGGYEYFKISDPKPRDIHKASVRDRLMHHALYRQLYLFFDRTFINDSYSCRLGKGTHRAMNRFRTFARRASKNGTRTCWVLKCDIRKCFASIDQQTLLEIVDRYVPDTRTRSLIGNIVGSFDSGATGKGLPLGNLTSQLFVNIYLNELDQFAKHKLKARYYIRYADDFVLLSFDRNYLLRALPYMEVFLRDTLKLALHPDKVSIKTLAYGVDYLGWVHFSDHRVLRTSTKRRMFRRIAETNGKEATVRSYLGLLSHGNAGTLSRRVEGLGKI